MTDPGILAVSHIDPTANVISDEANHMNDQVWLVQQFEANRAYLKAVAYRMLGSQSEAEDAVQEAWLRLSRVDGQQLANLRGWLTTAVGRVCLDMLRRRRAKR